MHSTRKYLFFITVLIISGFLTSCSDGPLGSFDEEYEPDGVSGLYHVEGMRIITENRNWPIESPDFTPDVDTTLVSFDLEIRLVDSKDDTVLLFSHEDPSDLQYGSLPNEHVQFANGIISYKVKNLQYLYTGEGAIKNDSLYLSAGFSYRGYNLKNELQGVKTEDRPSMPH